MPGQQGDARPPHAAICDAIARQDGEAAGAAMAAHMEHVTVLVRTGQETLATLAQHRE
ncbi:hypothetical protein [Solidesulfovibrio sp.]|uniref:FCD domain-containing protein n=1 Tax=Solidesulfovibrio sp. TaxID=2910990 RepID=UPI002623176D|nr:hypothetical protein [Solidesulfovibrio sp.]